MKDYKNIDRLFQEKFRDFEQNPSPHLWRDINDALSGKPKKDRRVLWLWLSGVAAGLALLVTFNNPFSTTIITPKTNTSNTNDTTIEKINNPETEITNTTTKDLNTTQTKIDKHNSEKEITTNTTQKNYNQIPTTTTNNSKNIRQKVDKTYIVSNESSDQKNNAAIPNLKENISENKALISQTDKTRIESSNKSTVNLSENTEQHDKSIAINNNSSPKEITNTIPLESANKKSPQTDIASTVRSSKKWVVSTVAAPVLFNAFNKDVSSIDPQFDKNIKKGQISAAYGVQLAYQINDRFKIQSGLHKVDYGYKTQNVYVSPDRYASVYSNITYDDDINIIEINAVPFNGSPHEYETNQSKDLEGSLTQVLGYYEIPIETKYNLKKGNFGINLLSGFSALILNKNEIYIQTEEFSSKVGKASNLNSLNLTGNLGVELDYKIYQNIHFNLTPIFKIHANTFKKDTGGFNPYAIGVYSGLNYRF